MQKKQFVKDLKVGDSVDSIFLVLELKYYNFADQKRMGEKFVRLYLGDITGSIKSIFWKGSLAEEKGLSPGDVVAIKGEVGDYNGHQVNISYLEIVPEELVDRRHFQVSSPRDNKEMLTRMSQIMDKEITDGHLRLLLASFFKDKDFSRAYATAPAARKIHHNYLGGLLEHSLEVAEYCLVMIRLYPGKLHPSLLLTGAILHDIGKI
ncbi:MAG TPA: HDIG domain-containing protein, partial [Firmicutes bacterium]|nr:HDIG domain-containing protein [Bacillota bacterium]